MHKPTIIAIESMSNLYRAETDAIYQPLDASILQWFMEHYIPKIDTVFHEPMTNIVNETLARFRMVGSSAMRRLTLATGAMENMPDVESVQHAILRELDLQLGSFMDDMSCATDGTPMAACDDVTRYEEMIFEIVDHIFETAREVLLTTIKDNMGRWHELLKTVHQDLYWTAENLGIVAYLSDHDNVVFSGEDVDDVVIVYGVNKLPELYTEHVYTDVNEFAAFKGEYFGDPWWSDQFIVMVNNCPAHPDYVELKAGDVMQVYEVEACRN